MLGELMNLMAKVASFDEIVSVLEEHIKMYKEGHKNGKDFLTKTCSLILTKSLQESGIDIDNEYDKYKESLKESKNDSKKNSIPEDMPEDLKEIYYKIKGSK
jgi:hypothetical protein